MQRLSISITLLSAAFALLTSSPAWAFDTSKPAAARQAESQSQANPSKAPVRRVDINTASRAELKTLPGIGDAQADRIIKARPYPSKAKLVADQVLPDAAYQAIKGRIVAVPPPAAKASTKVATKP